MYLRHDADDKKGGIILPNLNIEKEEKASLSAGDGALVWAAGGAGGAAVANSTDFKINYSPDQNIYVHQFSHFSATYVFS